MSMSKAVKEKTESRNEYLEDYPNASPDNGSIMWIGRHKDVYKFEVGFEEGHEITHHLHPLIPFICSSGHDLEFAESLFKLFLGGTWREQLTLVGR